VDKSNPCPHVATRSLLTNALLHQSTLFLGKYVSCLSSIGGTRGQRGSSPKDPQNTFLTKNCTKFIFFAQNSAWDAYSDYSGVRSLRFRASDSAYWQTFCARYKFVYVCRISPQEEFPLQYKFLATSMLSFGQQSTVVPLRKKSWLRASRCVINHIGPACGPV